MTLKKKIKIVTISLISTLLLLFIVLVYHIATKKPVDNATIQVSRIDFDKPFDSLSTIAIQNTIRTIPGVKSEVIVKRNVVVYFHDNKIADSKKIYDELMAKGSYKAQRFILPEGMASQQVCPVMNQNGLMYKFSSLVQRIFN